MVTDLGVLRRIDGTLQVAAVASGAEPQSERIRAFVAGCGWDVAVARSVVDLEPVTTDEVLALRRYDPERLFLS